MGGTVKLVLKPLTGHNEVDSGHGEETWKPEPNVATRLKCPCKGNIDGIVGTEEGARSFPSPCLPVSLQCFLMAVPYREPGGDGELQFVVFQPIIPKQTRVGRVWD